MSRRCATCATALPAETPGWATRCRPCFAAGKRAELDALFNENASLRAENARLRVAAGQIEPTMFRRLVQLCHPDRHGGSQAANDATIWLLAQRRGAAS